MPKFFNDIPDIKFKVGRVYLNKDPASTWTSALNPGVPYKVTAIPTDRTLISVRTPGKTEHFHLEADWRGEYFTHPTSGEVLAKYLYLPHFQMFEWYVDVGHIPPISPFKVHSLDSSAMIVTYPDNPEDWDSFKIETDPELGDYVTTLQGRVYATNRLPL
jgi:hypothetical protein